MLISRLPEDRTGYRLLRFSKTEGQPIRGRLRWLVSARRSGPRRL